MGGFCPAGPAGVKRCTIGVEIWFVGVNRGYGTVHFYKMWEYKCSTWAYPSAILPKFSGSVGRA